MNQDLRSFVEMTKVDKDFHRIKVRGLNRAKRLGVFELRTKKNTYQAVAHDILGNTSVLDNQGRIFQLIGNEYKAV